MNQIKKSIHKEKTRTWMRLICALLVTVFLCTATIGCTFRDSDANTPDVPKVETTNELDELDALKAQNEAAQREIEALMNSIAAAQQELDDLKSKNTTAQTEIDDLKDQNEAARQEINSLKNSNSTAQQEIDSLKANNNAAQKEIDTLKSNNEAAQQEIDSLKTDNEAAQKEIDTLKNSNDAAQKEIDALKNSNDAAQKEIDTLKNSNEAAQEEIDALKNSNDAAQEEIDRLKEQIQNMQGQTPPDEPTDKIRIYIDQGHNPTSFHNAGASGNGLYEQDLTFTIGCLLAELLEEDGRFEIRLSRPTASTVLGTDNTSSLEARVQGAKDFGADYFISLHTNSFYSESAHGIEVFAAEEGTTSYSFGNQLLQGLINSTNLRNRGMKINPELYVLKNAAMPATLVEMGFISNPNDAALLSQQPELFANGIYDGILAYFDLPTQSITAN